MSPGARTLIVLRHGKAAPHDAYARDDDRPLIARGHAEAEFIGQHLATHGPRPDAVISSPVLRALTTAQIVARHLGVPLRTDDRLSTDLHAASVVRLVRESLSRASCLLIAGHNPTLSEVVADLLANDQPGRGDLHTGEAAIIGFDGEVTPGTGRMIDRVRLEADPH